MAAEVNGSSAPAKEEEEPMDVSAAHTENYQTLIDAGLPQKVAESLDNIFQTGELVITNSTASQITHYSLTRREELFVKSSKCKQ